MNRIWIFVVIAFLVLLLFRAAGPRTRKRDSDPCTGSDGSPRGRSRRVGPPVPKDERMVQCAQCGVHLPASEATYAAGRAYCGPEHRDLAGHG